MKHLSTQFLINNLLRSILGGEGERDVRIIAMIKETELMVNNHATKGCWCPLEVSLNEKSLCPQFC